ncbi:MAG: phosphopantetheine-binding protein [Myxococcaceae bacterium]
MPTTDTELRTDIKKLIVETLRLEDLKPEDIKDADPLFSREVGLGLDSLNALELLTAIEYKFGVRFESDGTAKQHFQSVASLAEFVKSTKAS